jgi:hypothetical protein
MAGRQERMAPLLLCASERLFRSFSAEDRTNILDWVLDALQGEIFKECVSKVDGDLNSDHHGELAFLLLTE